MKKRLLAGLLALVMLLALLPVGALADSPQPYDVYQGDGFYITATPFKLNSTKYTIGGASTFEAGDHSFHDGMLVVWADQNSDESYVNREYVWEINLADKNGNIVLPDGSLLSYGLDLYHARATYIPSEGLVMFWDKETGLYGYKDYSGRVVIPAQFEKGDYLRPFREGLAYISAGISAGSFIDQTGRTAIDKIFCYGDYFSDGLIPGSRDNGNGTWTEGYFDKTGTMVLPLVTYSMSDLYGSDEWKMYAGGKTDGYLLPMIGTRSHFSEGYAVVQDLRSGSEGAYAYAIIDKSGSVVGTFRDAKVKSGVHDGLIGVEFLDARGNSTGNGYIDIHGNVVFRSDKNDKNGVPYSARPFNCGVTYNGSVLYDTKGNVVIPEGHFHSYNSNAEFAFDGNLSLAVCYADNGLYVLEIHQGTYSGSGRVYNHSTGDTVTVPTASAKYTTSAQSTGTTTVQGWGETQTVSLYPAGTVFTLSEGYTFSDIHQLNGDHIPNGGRTSFALPADGVYRIFIINGAGASEYLYVSAGGTSQPTEQPSSWAQADVTAATQAGLVPESLRSSYTQATTRAEFCALAVALYETVTGKEIEGRTTFSDTSDVNVEKAAYLGVVNGIGNNQFGPEGTLTREQAAAMLSRLAGAVGKPLADQAPTFADNASISSWAQAAVGQMKASGVMGGVGNNTFAPQGDYSREQSIITIKRLFELVK